jgi:hypothetical protein
VGGPSFAIFSKRKVSQIVGSRFFRRFVAGNLVVAIAAGGSLLLGGAANAAPASGTLGALTFTAATGLDTQIISVRTSAGCSRTSNAASMEVTGPVGATTPVFPPGTVITTTEKNTFSTARPFTIPEGVSLKDAADILHTKIVPGEYDFTVFCQDQDFLTKFGTFTGAIFFTDSTHYNTGAAEPPPVSPKTSPNKPDSGSATSPGSSDSGTATSPRSSDSGTATSATRLGDGAGGTSTSSDPPDGTQPVASTGVLAKPGASMALIFVGGLILLAAGLSLVMRRKRPKKAASGDEGDTFDR